MPSPPLSIVQSLSPRIALLTSDDVVGSCEANGCRGLDELLRPWEGSTERGTVVSKWSSEPQLIRSGSVHPILHLDPDHPPHLPAPIRQLRLNLSEPRCLLTESRYGH
jgi:hypothetical protein